MRKRCLEKIRITLFLLLFLCLSASAALAADATEAEVNGVVLNAASPYWKRGGGGSAGDWNAYFDTSTSVPTLYLKDAVMDTLSLYHELLYADGDIRLVLLGDNYVTYSGSAASPVGIYIDGDLVIMDGTADGTGRLFIEMATTDIASEVGGIVAEYGNITIESGTIDVGISPVFYAAAVYTDESLNINGGDITLHAAGFYVETVWAWNFNLAGGSVAAYVDGVVPYATALIFENALVTGGYGWFGVDGAGDGIGAVWDDPETGYFRVLDGRIIFTGRQEALFFYTNETIMPYVVGRCWTSTNQTGIGKFPWNASQGILASNNLEGSDFRYVEIEGYGISQPRTGDTQRPWLWLFIGTVLVVAGSVLWLRYKKRK